MKSQVRGSQKRNRKGREGSVRFSSLRGFLYPRIPLFPAVEQTCVSYCLLGRGASDGYQ